jgi:RNA 2',3'-cyclic 3'-phosphodiesterase
MRLFIAIELPDKRRGEIAQWMKSLAQAIPDPQHRLRWVKEEQLHLTLKFLGETPEDQIPPLSSALKVVAAAHSRFPLSLAKVGHFGGRVVWLGVDAGAEDAANLAQSIEESCDSLGFTRENRPFRPHLTLARSKMNPGTIRMANLPLPVAQKAFGPIPVSDVSLVQSTPTPKGSIYTILGRYPFKTD